MHGCSAPHLQLPLSAGDLLPQWLIFCFDDSDRILCLFLVAPSLVSRFPGLIMLEKAPFSELAVSILFDVPAWGIALDRVDYGCHWGLILLPDNWARKLFERCLDYSPPFGVGELAERAWLLGFQILHN